MFLIVNGIIEEKYLSVDDREIIEESKRIDERMKNNDDAELSELYAAI